MRGFGWLAGWRRRTRLRRDSRVRRKKLARKQRRVQAKAGTKQAVEARLKEVEKPKAESAIHQVEKTLFATHQFGQAVISPDGKRVTLGGDVDWEGWGAFGEDGDLRFGD